MKITRTKTKPTALQKAVQRAVQSTEAQVEYRKLTVVEELLQIMKREGITKSELASRMGVRPSRITAMLNGTSNLTLETLVKAGRAMGTDLQQTFVPQGEHGHWVSYGKARSQGRETLTVNFRSQGIPNAVSPQLSTKKRAQYDVEDAA